MKRIDSYVILLILINAAIVTSVIVQIHPLIDVHSYSLLLLSINFLVIIFSFLILWFLRIRGQELRKEVEIENLQNYVEKTKMLIDALNVQAHEHKRNLQTLKAMIALREIEEAEEYLNEITENQKTTDMYLYVEDPALNVTLNTQKKLAKNKNINFNFGFKDDISTWNIRSWDVNAIVGNLLNNSFEAVMNRKKTKRYVGLEFLKDEESDSKIIRIINSGPKLSDSQKSKIFEQGYSTKGSGRGYGLHIVKEIVDKYHGEIKITSNEFKTVFELVLPLCEEETSDDKKII
ncbi:sensor histidine kinase [Natranaerobius thermophilus]|uniref:sensor histidine kinase n=1 Tax=Natranaerobius thermophilus TaxID=375929 RepID=UPI0001663C39|nr:GHKL domain-containing protein [Natranaerobius thermophilus]